MTARDLGTVALRLAGVYLLVKATALIPQSLEVLALLPRQSLFEPAIPWWNLALATPIGLLASTGLLLLGSARRLSARLVPDASGVSRMTVLGENLEAAALSVAGVVVLGLALSRWARVVFAAVLAARGGAGDIYLFLRRGPVSGGEIVELITLTGFGLWLCLASRGLVTLLRRIRDAGWTPRERARDEPVP